MKTIPLTTLELSLDEQSGLPLCFRKIQTKDAVEAAAMRHLELYSPRYQSLTVGIQKSEKPISKLILD